MSAKWKVIDRATGKVHYMAPEEVARIPRKPRRISTWPEIPESVGRNTAITLIRDALKRRSGKTWSVTGGRGTSHGWISIDAPPARRTNNRHMTPTDQAELGVLLGLDGPVHFQGESIPAGKNYYLEYIARARGLEPTVYGKPYWD